MVEVMVDSVADAKANSGSGATIIGMGIGMIMEMVFKIGAMLACDISVIRSVDGIPPMILDYMPLGSVILALLPCLMTVIIGNCQGILLVSQLALEYLQEAERALKPNAVWIFLK